MNYKLNRNLNNIVNNLTKLAEDIFRMYSNKQNVLDKSGIFLNTFIDFMLLIKNVTTSFKNNKEKEQVDKELKKLLSNLTNKGSGDDCTICYFINKKVLNLKEDL